MTPMRARSRRPTMLEVSMLSRSSRAWSVISTGVLPRFTTCLGPRTEELWPEVGDGVTG